METECCLEDLLIGTDGEREPRESMWSAWPDDDSYWYILVSGQVEMKNDDFILCQGVRHSLSKEVDWIWCQTAFWGVIFPWSSLIQSWSIY